jgi:regulatory protein YycI of two-component signal transduction system YycFG
MRQFLNWEKTFKIFVVISLLLNLVLTLIIFSSLEDIEDSLYTITNNASIQGDNGRYKTFQDGVYVRILDTRTGEVKYAR